MTDPSGQHIHVVQAAGPLVTWHLLPRVASQCLCDPHSSLVRPPNVHAVRLPSPHLQAPHQLTASQGGCSAEQYSTESAHPHNFYYYVVIVLFYCYCQLLLCLSYKSSFITDTYVRKNIVYTGFNTIGGIWGSWNVLPRGEGGASGLDVKRNQPEHVTSEKCYDQGM